MSVYCLSCGRPVQGGSHEFNGQGPYCASCCQERPPCDVCGAPLTQDRWLLSDGRTTCAVCHSTAIYAPRQALALYDEMKSLAGGRLGLRLNIPTGLALVDQDQLRQVIHRQTTPISASIPASPQDALAPTEEEAKRTLGLYARRGMRRGIYIQTGLPRLLFLQVAAHEFAHAWQGENCPTLLAGLAYEGFAEWVAFQVLGFYDYSQGQEKMLARQDLYGQGLRWALAEATGRGPQGLLDALRAQA